VPEPAAACPFSHAVRAGDFLFVSGLGPIDLGTDQFSCGGAQNKTCLTREIIQHILQCCGATMKDIVKYSISLTALEGFAGNEVYEQHFLVLVGASLVRR